MQFEEAGFAVDQVSFEFAMRRFRGTAGTLTEILKPGSPRTSPFLLKWKIMSLQVANDSLLIAEFSLHPTLGFVKFVRVLAIDHKLPQGVDTGRRMRNFLL